MFGSGILDVAIGLVLLYLVLSMMASAANEILSNVTQSRANNLEKFIRQLFLSPQTAQKANGIFGVMSSLFPHRTANSPEEKAAEGLVKHFYEQTLIAPHLNGGARPSYIAAPDFALAIFDMVFPDRNGTSTIQDWQAAISKMPGNFPLKNVLSSALDKADGDVTKLQKGLETWFDSSMDRVSGWYKRQTQLLLLLMGLGIALVLNLDTITITNRLLQNPALRDSISKQTALIVAQVSPLLTATPGASGTSTTTGSSTQTPDQSFALIKQQLDLLNLPMGWADVNLGDLYSRLGLIGFLGWIIQKAVGICITGFAVSQGAPFWFDMLNKITNLRSTGKPPEKTDAAG